MPNWIKNKILVGKPEFMEELQKRYEGSNERFDFNKVIPMPDGLDVECGSKGDDGLMLYMAKINPKCSFYGTKEDKVSEVEYKKLLKNINSHLLMNKITRMTKKEVAELSSCYKDKIGEVIALGQKMVTNVKNYGSINWYDWSIKNWGTKWNSSETIWEEKDVIFETAWEPALPVVMELSKQNPKMRIALLYSDEDIGDHVGYMLVTGGRIDYQGTFEDGSRDAYKLAFELWGCENEYRYDNKKGRYVYNEQ